MGDPAGIGPEVVLKALLVDSGLPDERFIVLGDRSVFERTVRECGIDIGWDAVVSPDEIDAASGDRVLVDLGNVPADLPREPTEQGGRASLDYFHAAIDMAITGSVHAMATAPIHKTALALAGCPHPGHTEILAERTGSADFVMMLAGPKLRVALVTIHVPLRQVFELLTTDRIARTITVTYRGLRELFGIEEPRIAVAGLNPHAGESGRFGHEDADIIAPAIERAGREGINCSGPHPPDTVFNKALNGKFDAVVAMYHDQGLIAIKSSCFETAVNITLGLPIIRTSADHGTAYDIAGKGMADCTSMAQAIELAGRFASRRRGSG